MMYAIPYALIAVGVGFFVCRSDISDPAIFQLSPEDPFILRNDRVKKNAVRNGGLDAN